MKNRKTVILTAVLCIAALGLGSCFSSWNGETDEGTISINLGDNGARAGLATGPGTGTEGTEGEGETGGTEPPVVYYYTIALSPAEKAGEADQVKEAGEDDKAKETDKVKKAVGAKETDKAEGTEEVEGLFFGPFKGGSIINIAVSPGDWDITVKAYETVEAYYTGRATPYAEGKSEDPVTVIAGKNSPVEITMTVIDYSDPLGTIKVEIGWVGQPPTDVSYTVAVTNADGDGDNDPESKTVESFDETVTIEVKPGKWDIIVLAYDNDNDSEDPIATGTSNKTVTVTAGKTSTATITMELIDNVDIGDPSGMINVGINWDNIPANVSYTVTVTNTDGDNEKTQKLENVSIDALEPFEVEPGNWKVEVEASVGVEPKAYGVESVEVGAGSSVIASVDMKEVTKVARTWADLIQIFTSNSSHEVVVITGTLEANSPLNISGVRWNITLLAEQDVTIKKIANIQNSLFRVLPGCKLTLDGTGGGTITIDGNGFGNSSLIVVQAEGELIMNDGVILKNNNATSTDPDRGGGVTVDGGIFTMKGGTISGNSTVSKGGGVYVDTGTFIKEGGTIYGYTEGDSESNKANNNQGHAVYAGSNSVWNDTSGPTDTIRIPAAGPIAPVP